MVVFGDKNTGKYIETEYSAVNRKIIVKWHNYPIEILYYGNARNEDQYVLLSNWLCNILPMNNDAPLDMSQARNVLEMAFCRESIAKTEDEISAMKNRAFDNTRSGDEYWYGVFDALRWVFGDKVEEFEYV